MACRQDMHDQPSLSALEASPFFADKSASRMPVAGTVPRGYLRDDERLYTGMVDGKPALDFPFPIDEAVLARGQEAFGAFCSHCHGRSGAGDGMVVQRGFTRPPNLTSRRIQVMPVGRIFIAVTNGVGTMPGHAAQIKVSDRWAIAAYVRTLPPAQRVAQTPQAGGAAQP